MSSSDNVPPSVGRGGRGELMRRAMQKYARRPQVQHEVTPPAECSSVPDHPGIQQQSQSAAVLRNGGGFAPPPPVSHMNGTAGGAGDNAAITTQSATAPTSQSARMRALIMKQRRAQMMSHGEVVTPGPRPVESAPPQQPDTAAAPSVGGRGSAMNQRLQSYHNRTASDKSDTRAGSSQRNGGGDDGVSVASSCKQRSADNDGRVVAELSENMDRMMGELSQAPVNCRGKSGRPISVFANYIELRLGPGRAVHEYELKFEPQQDSMTVRYRLLAHESVKQVIGRASVHDGGKYYLPHQLNQQVTSIDVPHPSGECDSVKVSFVHKKQVPLETCMHLLNVCMKRVMSRLQMTQMKRCYYDSHSAFNIDQHQMEVWPGFITAVHCYDGGVKLNVDVVHRVLHKRTVLDVIVEAVNSKKDGWYRDVCHQIIGSVVLTRYNKRTYRVDDIDCETSPLSTFTQKNGQETTFKQYYKNTHMIDIENESQPMLITRMKRAGSLGKELDVRICLVPELCTLTGLTDPQRADHRLMKSLVSMTAVRPDDRVRKLQLFVRRIRECPEAMAVLEEWGLSLDDGPSRVDARQLNPERLVFGGDACVVPDSRDLSWDRAVKSNKMLTAVNLQRWVLVFLNRNAHVARQFVDCLLQCGPALGMQVAPPIMVELANERTETFISELRRRIKPDVQLLVTLMPSQREDRYAAIKRLCYVEMPVANQVVNFRTLNKDFGKLRPIVFKIAMQINCKLGGELWACKSPLRGTMVCGVDVYHAGTGATASNKSVLAFVSALNCDQTRFYSQARYHRAGQEMGDTLSTCLLQAARQWLNSNGSLPQNIVVFRDGVGDGQLRGAIILEVSQYESVLSSLGDEYKPNLYVVVVQKRINARFFQEQGRSMVNVGGGCVVDHTVTARNQYDFYLVSQHVQHGTVAPTHYVVVRHVPGHWPPDYLQRLAYQSCHLYYNWCGTVRVPAAVQYAHRLAFMVGQVLHDCPNEQMSSRLFYL